jgi:hypothetical protein
MIKALSFLLESLLYQTNVVEAMVGVFESTSRPVAHEFEGNRFTLRWSQIRSNLLARERVRRVIQGYGENPQPINAGFKVFKLERSTVPRVEYAPDPNAEEATIGKWNLLHQLDDGLVVF